ncbi:MAG: retropepsin-like domain-containing protein [Candidatus Ryanbacteria bacterium]|nr:retropepsin-like domain-containing protein [Candidatus Ryanbacteria bacterium]
MSAQFPYLNRGGKYYPVVDITLFSGKTILTLKALLDSGASFSVFRPEVAEYLKIPIEKGKPFYLEGIGGRILGYLHILSVSVGKRKFRCKIVFSREFTVSFNLLGRDNFFENFLVTFDEKNHKTILG